MKSQETTVRTTLRLAIQSSAWPKFDEWGCVWVPDRKLAELVAQTYGEPMTLWACPAVGQPYPLAWL